MAGLKRTRGLCPSGWYYDHKGAKRACVWVSSSVVWYYCHYWQSISTVSTHRLFWRTDFLRKRIWMGRTIREWSWLLTCIWSWLYRLIICLPLPEDFALRVVLLLIFHRELRSYSSMNQYQTTTYCRQPVPPTYLPVAYHCVVVAPSSNWKLLFPQWRLMRPQNTWSHPIADWLRYVLYAKNPVASVSPGIGTSHHLTGFPANHWFILSVNGIY